MDPFIGAYLDPEDYNDFGILKMFDDPKFGLAFFKMIWTAEDNASCVNSHAARIAFISKFITNQPPLNPVQIAAGHVKLVACIPSLDDLDYPITSSNEDYDHNCCLYYTN